MPISGPAVNPPTPLVHGENIFTHDFGSSWASTVQDAADMGMNLTPGVWEIKVSGYTTGNNNHICFRLAGQVKHYVIFEHNDGHTRTPNHATWLCNVTDDTQGALTVTASAVTHFGGVSARLLY